MKKRKLDEHALVYREVDSPLGPLLLVASHCGLAKISFTPAETIEEMRSKGLAGGRPTPAGDDRHSGAHVLDRAESQLSEFFSRKREDFSVVVDLSSSFGNGNTKSIPNPWVSPDAKFRTRAQVALQMIPYGETVSYGELALTLNNVGASRAVGTACATNPVPIILPCHRVTRSDGTFGQYAGGVPMKEALLRLESGKAI